MRLTAWGARKTLVVAVMGCMGTHIPLHMETDVGRPSRWNTLRALRVRNLLDFCISQQFQLP
jgi:hypothetical protein